MAVVDASVVAEFVAPDADRIGPVHALFDQWVQTGEKLHAPVLLPLEVMNALVTGVCRGRWDGHAADIAGSFVGTLPTYLHDDDGDRHRAWELARRYDNHPIYDMLYVALTQRLGEALITVDDRLRRRLAPLNLILHPTEALQLGA